MIQGSELVMLNCDVLVGCRIYDDMRLCIMFQLILPLAIAVVAFAYRSNYTRSRYWFSSLGMPLTFVTVIYLYTNPGEMTFLYI